MIWGIEPTPRVIRGYLVRELKLENRGWVFCDGGTFEVFIRADEEGTGWERGHTDGESLRATWLLVGSTR